MNIFHRARSGKASHIRVQKRTFPKRKYADVPNGLNQPFYLVRRTALETYFNPLIRCQTCCSPLHSEHRTKIVFTQRKGESLCYRRKRHSLLPNSVSVSCPSASFLRDPRPSPRTQSSSARQTASLHRTGAASARRRSSVTQRQFSGFKRVSLVTGPESRGPGSERHDRRNQGTAERVRFTPLCSLRDLNSHLRGPRRAIFSFSRVEHRRTAPPISRGGWAARAAGQESIPPAFAP